MSAITAKASRKMKKYAVLTREPRCFLGSFDFSWEQRKLSEMCGTFEYGLNAAAKEFDGKNKYIRITDIDDASREFLLSDLSSPDICLDGMSKYLLSSGDIVFARTGASVGKTYIYRENDGIVYFAGFLIRAKVNQDNDAEFVFQSTLSPSYEKYIRITSQRSGQPGVNAQEYGEYDLFAPSKEEQQRIGQFLRGIDNLITLHQRKCALLFSSFQALISMMFTTSTFSWEQRKFGEITSKYEDPVPTPHDGYYRLGIRSHAKGTFHSYVAKGQELETAQMHRVAAGNFIVNITFGWEHAVAITDKNDAGKLVSHRFPQFSFAEGMVPEFFRYVIVDEKFRHHLWLASPGGAGRNRVLKLDEMLNYLMRFPSRDEQIKIAEFFRHLDNLITLHQRKCISFTGRAGRLISTVNKKRITSSWEQRKLGDIGETYTGLSGKTKADFGHGQARFVTYMNVFSNPISNPEMTEPIEIDPKQNEVEVGDVFFTTSSETPEEVGMSSVLLEKRGKTYLNSFCFGFRPSEIIDSYYLAYMLRSESARDKIILLAQGISRYNISKNKVMEIAVSLPSLDEQKLIGQYFRQLDNLITLHQRKPFLMKWRTSDANRNQTNRLVL